MSLWGKYANKSSRMSSQKTLAKDNSGEILVTDQWTCILGRTKKTKDSAEIKHKKHIAQNMIWCTASNFWDGCATYRRPFVLRSTADGKPEFQARWAWRELELGNGYLTMVQKSRKPPKGMYKTIVILAHSASTQENNPLFFIQPNPAQLPASSTQKEFHDFIIYLSFWRQYYLEYIHTLHVCVIPREKKPCQRLLLGWGLHSRIYICTFFCCIFLIIFTWKLHFHPSNLGGNLQILQWRFPPPKKNNKTCTKIPWPNPPEFSWLMIENGLKLIFDGLKGDLCRPEVPPETLGDFWCFSPKSTQQNGGKLHWI